MFAFHFLSANMPWHRVCSRFAAFRWVNFVELKISVVSENVKYIWYAECRPLGVIYVCEIKSDRSDRIAYFMQHLKGLEAAYTRVCSRSKFYP